MAKFLMDDGTILVTSKSARKWEEDTRWDGNNHISVNTGSQWNHQTLYKSSKGRYYLVSESNYQHVTPSAEFVSEEDAGKWLMLNNHDVPDELASFVNDVTE